MATLYYLQPFLSIRCKEYVALISLYFSLLFLIAYPSARFLAYEMAEVAGLALSVVTLVGLFNNTVDCFKYVQLGRGLGKSFQTSQLKLDNARLRLS